MKTILRDDKYEQMIEKRFQEIRDNLIKDFDPLKIIVFGSFARKEEGENSSIDVLVIVGDSDMGFIERIKKAIASTRGNPPVDPLVYTQDEIDRLLNEGDYFADNVLKEGILLYSK